MNERALFVSRPLSSHDHQAIRSQLPRVNVELPDYASVKWRQLGRAGLTLVHPGEYVAAARKEGSQLRNLDIEEVSEILQYGLSAEKIGTEQLSARVEEMQFIGLGNWTHIAMMVDSPELMAERERVTSVIDELSGVNSPWREFSPHISLATVEAKYADDDVLAPFKRTMPHIVALNPVRIGIS